MERSERPLPGRAVLSGLLIAALLLAACSPAAPMVSQAAAPVPSEPTVSAVLTAVPTLSAGWKTYTESTLAYSLSFPQDVEFTSGVSKAGVYTARLQFTLPGVDGYQGMVVRVEPNPAHKGIEQISQEIYRRNLLEEPPADLLQQLQSISVAGLSGVQLGAGGDFSLIVPYRDHVYIIAPVHDLATTALDPQALALFYQVLATLRLAP